MIENEPESPRSSPKLILALVGVAVLGILMLGATLWNMPPDSRNREVTIILAMLVVALFIGYLFDRRNKNRRPKIIIRFPSRR
jgi:hypothetical protein